MAKYRFATAVAALLFLASVVVVPLEVVSSAPGSYGFLLSIGGRTIDVTRLLVEWAGIAAIFAVLAALTSRQKLQSTETA